MTNGFSIHDTPVTFAEWDDPENSDDDPDRTDDRLCDIAVEDGYIVIFNPVGADTITQLEITITPALEERLREQLEWLADLRAQDET